MALRTDSYRYGTLTVRDHRLTVPWDHSRNDSDPGENLVIFARELSRQAESTLPYLVYLQGGPGFPSPRPEDLSGWLEPALDRYRVLLLDQRGTGNSTRIDATTPELISADRLRLLRADSIVADAEALRRALGVERWSLLGQSFGGFCITTYLSRHPQVIDTALFTGGLPGIEWSADEVYRATFAATRRRHDAFYALVPWAEQRIREVCHHLDSADERLPTGERLSSRRLRTVGIELGRARGFWSLAALFEEPFTTYRGEKRLRGDFLAAVGQRVSFAQGPLYAAVHESIYGGNQPGPTNWSAHRIREEEPGFAEAADPRAAEPFYLTGEHIFPWQFEEDPALRPFAAAAEELAQAHWAPLYHPDILAGEDVARICSAAAIYVDDMFVPFSGSRDLAERLHLNPWITNEYQHNGLRADGARIFSRLHQMAARGKVD